MTGSKATRMLREGRHKLIWYPAGNRVQLFDLEQNPREMRDLSQEPSQAGIRERLERSLVAHLYGEDLDWVRDECLAGLPEPAFEMKPNASCRASGVCTIPRASC